MRKQELQMANIVIYMCSNRKESSQYKYRSFFGQNLFHDEYYQLHWIETTMWKCLDVSFCPMSSVTSRRERQLVDALNEVPIFYLLTDYSLFIQEIFRRLSQVYTRKSHRAFTFFFRILLFILSNFQYVRVKAALHSAITEYRHVLDCSRPVSFDYYNDYNMTSDRTTDQNDGSSSDFIFN